MKILFVWPNKDSFGFKPIGLSLLAGIAQDLKFEVKLFDTTGIDFGFIDNTMAGENAKIFKPVDLSPYGLEKKNVNLNSEFLSMLEDFKPDCLAFSVLSDEFFIAAQISTLAKEKRPDLPIIWGGKFPTLNPAKTLSSFGADFVCIGEGLDAFREFLLSLQNNKDLSGILNLWSKKDGEIIKNDIRPIRQNIDDLPYLNWEIFDQRQFYKPFDGKIYIGGDHMLNWGCPYSCTYCINHFYHTLYKNKYSMRRYSIKRVIAELKHLKEKYRLSFFKFHDEDFLMRPTSNLRQLSNAYKQEIGLPFVIETNPKSVTQEKVKLLKNMNCVSVSLAIETGDPELRKKLLKRVDNEGDIVRAFSLLNDAGIRTSSFNMLGIPFESRQTYQKTVEINRGAKVRYPHAGFFYPFEGTQLREIAIKNGFFNPDDNEKIVYKRDLPALTLNNLSEEELVEMRNVFVLYVKLPESYEPFIKRSEIQDSLGRKLRKLLLKIYENTVWKNDGYYIDDGHQNSYFKELKSFINCQSSYIDKV